MIDGVGLTKKDTEKGGNVQGGSIGTGDKAIALKQCKIALNHVHHYPIYITTGCRNRGPKDVKEPSRGQNIMISNIQALDCDSLAGIIITGMEQAPLKNIALQNIHIEYRGGGTKEQGKKEYREQGTNYPEPRWAGPTPAYGLYARHVEGLQLRNITFSLKKKDDRPAVIMKNVKNVAMSEIKESLGTITRDITPQF